MTKHLSEEHGCIPGSPVKVRPPINQSITISQTAHFDYSGYIVLECRDGPMLPSQHHSHHTNGFQVHAPIFNASSVTPSRTRNLSRAPKKTLECFNFRRCFCAVLATKQSNSKIPMCGAAEWRNYFGPRPAAHAKDLQHFISSQQKTTSPVVWRKKSKSQDRLIQTPRKAFVRPKNSSSLLLLVFMLLTTGDVVLERRRSDLPDVGCT